MNVHSRGLPAFPKKLSHEGELDRCVGPEREWGSEFPALDRGHVDRGHVAEKEPHCLTKASPASHQPLSLGGSPAYPLPQVPQFKDGSGEGA